jgi:hypothetical protein
MQLREGKKQEMLLVMQVLATLPIIAQNPAAQYRLAVEFCEIFNIDFTAIMEEPPPLFSPRLPETEWTMLLEGSDIVVHPQDDDQTHITDHENRIVAMSKAKPENQDWDAMLAMRQHIMDHQQQMVAKQQAQEVMQGLQQLVGAAQSAIGQPGGQPGQAVQGPGQNPNGSQPNPLAQMMGGMPGAAGSSPMGGTPPGLPTPQQ